MFEAKASTCSLDGGACNLLSIGVCLKDKASHDGPWTPTNWKLPDLTQPSQSSLIFFLKPAPVVLTP